MNATQTQIDFTRAEQLHLIGSAELPAVVVGATEKQPGRAVSSVALKSVLRTIDDHARGRVAWLGFEAIARESGVSLRQAKRAVAGLVALSLVCVERRRSPVGVVCNHYSVVWSELALLARPRAAASVGVNQGVNQSATCVNQSATCANQSATCANQSATCANQSATVALKPHTTAQGNAPQPPRGTSAAVGGGNRRPEAGPSGAAGAAVVVGLELLRGAGVVEYVARGLAARHSAEEIAAVVGEYNANRSRLRGPGAIVARLGAGVWPADGVRPAADLSAAIEANRRRQAEAVRRSLQRAGV